MLKYVAGALAVAAIAAIPLAYGLWPVALLMVVMFAWFAARALVHGGFDAFHWLRHGHMREWNGRYYEFANQQIRAAEVNGQLVFLERDLLALIEQPESTTVELFGAAERVGVEDAGEKALTEKGCERQIGRAHV